MLRIRTLLSNVGGTDTLDYRNDDAPPKPRFPRGLCPATFVGTVATPILLLVAVCVEADALTTALILLPVGVYLVLLAWWLRIAARSIRASYQWVQRKTAEADAADAAAANAWAAASSANVTAWTPASDVERRRRGRYSPTRPRR